MDETQLRQNFEQAIKDDPGLSHTIAAIKSLIDFINKTPANTLVELREVLDKAFKTLETAGGATASITSGCELFLRFITLTTLDHHDFEDCKKALVKRGKIFLSNLLSGRNKIAKMTVPFIGNGSNILVHARSRVVLEVLKQATEANLIFNVYVTESMPDKSGLVMAKELEALQIPTTVILDAAVGYYMEKVDFVLCGAEGVVESGGIINKIGTYTTALAAKELNKPVYVVAECFKFMREYPLNQSDIPDCFSCPSMGKDGVETSCPLVDYTPPSCIKLLFTDLGILTPSAVSDELIKLYS